MENNFILGTAGHVDHGKTTLIKALTGTDTDFLPEEKLRGISIESSFTHFVLNNGTTFGIIDVPGHEKFIKNMMTGAYGMDAVMIIIDGKSGIMPQTVEHIDILSFLNISLAIIVITKIDLISQDELELRKKEINDFIEDRNLKIEKIFCVDSISGKGIDKLKLYLQELPKHIKKDYNLSNNARLNIDRILSIPGHGTIVTGTLLDGKLNTGDSVKIFPQNINTKIRSIEVHSNSVQTAYPSQRTAINLLNINRNILNRGDIITTDKNLSESNIINTKIKVINGINKKLKHWDRLRLFCGTKEVFCRCVLLNKSELSENENAYVQLRLETPIYAKMNDNIILRSFSPVTTIAGGKILEIQAKKMNKISDKIISKFIAIENNSLLDVLNIYIAEYSPCSIYDISKYCGKSISYIKEILSTSNKVKCMDDIYVSNKYLEATTKSILNIIQNFHINNQNEVGISKDILINKIKGLNKCYNQIIKKIPDIEVVGSKLKLKTHKENMSDSEIKVYNNLLKEINSTTYTNFLNETTIAISKIDKKMLSLIVKEKKAMKLSGGFYIHYKLFNEIIDKIYSKFKINETITISDMKEILGSGRKNAIIILETLDELKLTRRLNNDRVIISKYNAI